MANAQTNGVLRHVRSLRAAHALAETSDAELLGRFANLREEEAFAALVRRHGAMVLGVARRLLPTAQDAEDVFQASFLLLARKAASIRKRDAVGCWLHGVARRLALKAREQEGRRHVHEKRAADMRSTRSNSEAAGRDVRAALDAALGDLPEKYRSALVFCYLEGKTHEEAARLLGCPLTTLRTRVARGRKLLRERLTSHGLTLSFAGLAALLITSAASAAAPAALVRSAVRAALAFAAGQPAAALCSARVAGLVEGGLGAMTPSKLKLATALLLMAGALTGAATWARGGGAAPHAVAQEKARPAEPVANGKSEDVLAYGGRVLGPVGKPVAGAKLYLTRAWGYSTRPYTTPESATTGADGRFAFAAPGADYRDGATLVVAAAPNHGIAWAEVAADGKKDDLTLRLVEDVPVAGQILDLEGKPVPGATLRLVRVQAAPGENLGPWLDAVSDKKTPARSRKSLEGQYLKRWTVAPPREATTDAEGRFRLAGFGRDRVVTLRLDGPTIVSQDLHVLTRPGETIAAAQGKGDLDGVTTYYPARFRHAAAPTRPIIGVVRDKDTKKPLAGVTVQSNRLANDPIPGRDLVETTTDAEGRYRLTGMPKGEGNVILLVPRADQPYLSVHAPVHDGPGLDPATVDFALKRGLWVEGKITDKATGKLVRGYVDYFALPGNPNLTDHPGFEGTVPPLRGVATKADGSYRVVGLPGPGLIAVYYTDHYLRAPERDDEYGIKEETLFTSPRPLGLPVNYSALARIDPAKGVDSVRRDVTLDPGWTFTGTLLGPDGKPVDGALGFGLTGRFPPWNREGMKAAEFAARRLNPREPRDVLFLHPEKGLVGVAPRPKDNRDSVTVRLEPGATVAGRLVGADGKPRAGVELELSFRPKEKPSYWHLYSPQSVTTDRSGRFRVAALLPGYEFRLSDDKGALPLGGAPRSGRTKDLGDVRLKGAEE